MEHPSVTPTADMNRFSSLPDDGVAALFSLMSVQEGSRLAQTHQDSVQYKKWLTRNIKTCKLWSLKQDMLAHPTFFKNLKIFDISNCGNLSNEDDEYTTTQNDEVVMEMVPLLQEKCQKLEEFNAQAIELGEVGFRALGHLFSALPMLRTLNLSESNSDTPWFALQSAPLPDSLESLDMSRTSCVVPPFPFPPNLKTINLQQNEMDRLKCAEILARLPDSLENLNLRDNTLAIPTSFPPHLKTLNLVDCAMDSNMFPDLLRSLPKTLELLDLHGNAFRGELALQGLRFPPHLKTLKMGNCYLDVHSLVNLLDVLPETVENLDFRFNHLRALPNFGLRFPLGLKTLEMLGCRLDEGAFLKIVRTLPDTLETFVFSWNHVQGLSNEGFYFPSNLRVLDLAKCELAMDDLSIILMKLPDTLEELDLSENRKIKWKKWAMEGYRFPSHLKVLDLSSCKLDMTGLLNIFLALPDALEILELSSNTLSKHTIALDNISFPQSLKRLILYRCRMKADVLCKLLSKLPMTMESLILSRSLGDNERISAWPPVHLPNLKILELGNCGLDRSVLNMMVGTTLPTTLKYLDLADNDIWTNAKPRDAFEQWLTESHLRTIKLPWYLPSELDDIIRALQAMPRSLRSLLIYKYETLRPGRSKVEKRLIQWVKTNKSVYYRRHFDDGLYLQFDFTDP